MAALRLCTAGTAAPASSILRPSSWSSRSILPFKMKTSKLSLGIRADKGSADQPLNPDPESADHMKKLEEMKKAREPPDMPFREEIDRIDEYRWKIRSTSIMHLGATVLSRQICSIAGDAVRLASEIVECVTLGVTDEISLHTVKQTVKTYVRIFISTAEDSYHKKVTRETIVSLLGGHQGVAAISHILLQDTLANRALIDNKDNSSYRTDVERAHQEYQRKMEILIYQVMTAQPAEVYQILQSTLTCARLHTNYFVVMMVTYRLIALGHVRGSSRETDDGEPKK